MKTCHELDLLKRLKRRSFKEVIETLAERCLNGCGHILIFSNGIPKPLILKMLAHHMMGDVSYLFKEQYGLLCKREIADSRIAMRTIAPKIASLVLDVVEDSRWETLVEDTDNGIILLQDDTEVFEIIRPMQKVYNVLADAIFRKASVGRIFIIIETLAAMHVPQYEGLYSYDEYEYQTMVEDYINDTANFEALRSHRLSEKATQLIKAILKKPVCW